VPLKEFLPSLHVRGESLILSSVFKSTTCKYRHARSTATGTIMYV